MLEWIRKAIYGSAASETQTETKNVPEEKNRLATHISGVRNLKGEPLFEVPENSAATRVLERAIEAGVDLTDADLRGLNLHALAVRGMEAEGVCFDETKFVNKIVPKEHGRKLDSATYGMRKANLAQPSFRKTCFHYEFSDSNGLPMEAFDIIGCHLPRADFTQAHFRGFWVSVQDSVLDGSKFDDVEVEVTYQHRYLDFIDTSLKNVDFSRFKPDGPVVFRTATVDEIEGEEDFAEKNGEKVSKKQRKGCNLDGARFPAEYIDKFRFENITGKKKAVLVYEDGREREILLTSHGVIFPDSLRTGGGKKKEARQTPTP